MILMSRVNMRDRTTDKAKGFTLTEVLVSLVILSSSFLALVQVAGNYTSNAIYLRDKTIAHWVGMNKMAELRLAEQFPDLGSTSGKEEMASREWFWEQEVEESANEQFRKVNLKVKLEQEAENGLINLTAFVRKPTKDEKEQ